MTLLLVIFDDISRDMADLSNFILPAIVSKTHVLF